MYKESILSEKSLDFAAAVVKFCVNLNQKTSESIITKQLIRSSTSIGANTSEESEYWLMLLYKSEYVSQDDVNDYIEQCKELERILVAALKTAKGNK